MQEELSDVTSLLSVCPVFAGNKTGRPAHWQRARVFLQPARTFPRDGQRPSQLDSELCAGSRHDRIRQLVLNGRGYRRQDRVSDHCLPLSPIPTTPPFLIETDPKKANAFDGRMAAEYADCIDKLELLLGVARSGHKHHDEKGEKEREKWRHDGAGIVALIVCGKGKNFSGGFGGF